MVINQVLTNQNQTNYLPIILEYSANLKLYWIQNENQLPVTAFDTLLKTTLLLTINHINNKFGNKNVTAQVFSIGFWNSKETLRGKSCTLKHNHVDWQVNGVGVRSQVPITNLKRLKLVTVCFPQPVTSKLYLKWSNQEWHLPHHFHWRCSSSKARGTVNIFSWRVI